MAVSDNGKGKKELARGKLLRLSWKPSLAETLSGVTQASARLDGSIQLGIGTLSFTKNRRQSFRDRGCLDAVVHIVKMKI